MFFPPRTAVRVFPGFQDSFSGLFLAVNLVSSVCVPQTVALCLSICVQILLFVFHSLFFFLFAVSYYNAVFLFTHLLFLLAIHQFYVSSIKRMLFMGRYSIARAMAAQFEFDVMIDMRR